MKIYVRRIAFEFYTENTNLTVHFEPLDNDRDFTYTAKIYENNRFIKGVKCGGNINKTKALNILKKR